MLWGVGRGPKRGPYKGRWKHGVGRRTLLTCQNKGLLLLMIQMTVYYTSAQAGLCVEDD